MKKNQFSTLLTAAKRQLSFYSITAALCLPLLTAHAQVAAGTYYIQNLNSGLYLDASGGGTANGTPLIQWGLNGGSNQKWNLNSLGSGQYSIIGVGSGLAVDDPGFSTAQGTALNLWGWNGGNNQKFTLQARNSGYYSLVFVNDGQAVNVNGASTTAGASVIQWANDGGNNSQWSFQSAGVINSVYTLPAASVPTASSGVLDFTIQNGTGTYANNQIYWCVLGINPANGQWSYLDLNGNLQPISAALNNASGHLVKNGVNYANIYHTTDQQQWMNIPLITSARMYISVGSPCYITTYDSGFAGPNIDNPADPNSNVYFDFIEFTIDSAGYHGNTTRVDMFGFPIQHRLVNKAGNFDQTVGELESESRAGIFSGFQSSVPSQFTSLATVQAPYRIVAPIHGSFAAGGANANYFAGYSSIDTQDILLGTGAASDPDTCAAINRHVYTLSNWNTVSTYYNAAPANYYAQFWHLNDINALAYGFCYDDVNGQAAYLSVADPKGLIIRVGW